MKCIVLKPSCIQGFLCNFKIEGDISISFGKKWSWPPCTLMIFMFKWGLPSYRVWYGILSLESLWPYFSGKWRVWEHQHGLKENAYLGKESVCGNIVLRCHGMTLNKMRSLLWSHANNYSNGGCEEQNPNNNF